MFFYVSVVQDLLECCSSQITSLFTEWEAKAVAVLNCMTDTNVRYVHTYMNYYELTKT